MDDAIERWLPVVGYEGFYEVSDFGQVRSVERVIRYRDGRVRRYPACVLRQSRNTAGYLYVGLSRNGVTTPLLVHWLVGAAFLGSRPKKHQTLHGPARQSDNSVANLSYGTAAQNAADTLRDGTRAQGNRLPCAKLTEQIVRECRDRYSSGTAMMKDLATEYGVSTSTMNVAIHRKTWKHVA